MCVQRSSAVITVPYRITEWRLLSPRRSMKRSVCDDSDEDARDPENNQTQPLLLSSPRRSESLILSPSARMTTSQSDRRIPERKTRKRRTNHLWKPNFVAFNGKEKFATKDELQQCLRSLAILHFKADQLGLNGLQWSPQNVTAPGKNLRQIQWCPFRTECKCNFRLEVMQVRDEVDDNVGYYTVRECSLPHADHTKGSLRARGCRPLLFRQYLQGLQDTPRDVINRIRMANHEIPVSLEKVSLKWATRCKTEYKKQHFVVVQNKGVQTAKKT